MYSKCKTFVYVPKKQGHKLDDKIILFIFSGYGNVEFEYRLLDPVKKKCITTRDVIFQEHTTLLDFDILRNAKKSEDTPLTTLISHLIKDAINERELHKEHGIDDIPKPIIVDDGVEQGK